ncbi:MAG: Clp protease N-terminal domain-containing protein [Planctomycetota bacterium]
MLFANRKAKLGLRHEIQVAHLMLGMLKEPTGLAGRFLTYELGDRRILRRALRQVGRYGKQFTIFGRLPLSDEVNVVIDWAVRYAQSRSHASVGTGGVLLAILQHDEATRKLLEGCGGDTDLLGEHLAEYLDRLMKCAPDEAIEFNL